MQFEKLFLFLTYLLLFSCGKKERQEGALVQSIQQTGRLVTVEYRLSKMIRASDNQTWYKVGDRRLLLSTEAIVKAGVDLQKVQPADVHFDENNIRLKLPPAQVFSVSLPPDKINVLYEDVSAFRSRFSAAERETLLRQAESQIRSMVDSLGVLKTAESNAELFLRKLLQRGGYQTITINFGP